MGWMSWPCLGAEPSDGRVRAVAAHFAESGLREAGYRQLVIEGDWQAGQRDADGRLQADPRLFPHGLGELAAHLHEHGFGLGLSASASAQTCGGRPGSLGHEAADAAAFAAWGIDLLSYDYCHGPDDLGEAMARYTAMGAALRACGRPITYAICEWGLRAPWLWARRAGAQMWRTAHDLLPTWDSPRNARAGVGVLMALERSAGLERHAGPGGWNDPHVLLLGVERGGAHLTLNECRAQFGMWCLLAAPLMLACDPRHLAGELLALAGNAEAIAIDQDPLGRPATCLARSGALSIWSRPLAGDLVAVGVLNSGDQPAEVVVDLAQFGFAPLQPVHMRDVWTRRTREDALVRVPVAVAPRDLRLFTMGQEAAAGAAVRR